MRKFFIIFFFFISFILLNSRVIAGVTYLGVGESFDTTSDNATPAGIHFNTDGTKVFVMGSNGTEDEVNEYSLATAFDISTTQTITRFLTVNTTRDSDSPMHDLHPYGITFNGDGTKLYISGNQNNKIFELDLGSAFNVSSATKVGELATNAHANGDGTPCGITFNNDGSKLFLAGFANHRIVYWSLSTPYDIETAGTPGEFSVTSTANKPRDVDFNTDGTKMYVMSGTNDHIAEFTLDTAFDLSSGVTHNGNFSVTSQDSQPFTMEFNSDGSKLFMQGYTDDKIHEYTLTTNFELINTAPTLSSASPSDGASSVGINDNIVLTFSEVVDAESGNIIIKKSSDDSTVETIGVTSSKVSGSGSTQITINPDTTLDNETGYYITIASTAFDDVDSSDYAGISDSTTLNFTTESGIDPFESKEVVALVEAQTEAPKRIVQHVTTPVYNRLNWLRGRDENSNLTSQNIKFQISNPILTSLVEAIPISNNSTDQKVNKFDDWSFWSEGSVSVGKIGDTTSSLPKDINTNGITVGMDAKLNKDILHGYAFTYTKDDVDVGSSGTSLNIDSYSISTYVGFHQDENKFVEGSFGINKLDLKHIRESGNNILHGDRDGQQIYGSINYITSIKSSNFTISPNFKIDISHTTLEDYSETGTNPLSYKKQDIQTGALYSGITFDSLIEKNNISFRPNFGVELGLDFSPSSDVEITYVSDPNTKYLRSIDQQDASGSISGKTKIGFDIMAETGWSLITLYERNQTENSHSDTLYFGAGYKPMRKEEKYAMVLNDTKASLEYFKNLNGLNIKFAYENNIFSTNNNQNANISLSKIY